MESMLTIRGAGPRGGVALRSLRRCAAPPGTAQLSPPVQTLRWTFRPLAFMDECRREFGDSFSVRFLGFERPMVLISDPAAIKALYTERAHGLPPGRNVILEPILGSRSLLLLEGADHFARRKLMLPAFHGERMRSYEAMLDEIVDAEIDSWPLRQRVPDPPADAGDHPRGDPARRLRRLRADPRLERLRQRALDGPVPRPASPRSQLIALATRRFRGGNACAKYDKQLKEVDELLYAEIAEHRTRPDLERARRHPLDADAAPLRGRRGDERQRAARPADDAAARRPRDDGDGARLDLRPAAAPPARAAAPARLARGRRGRLPAGDDHRVAAPAPGGAARRPPPRHGAGRRRATTCPPAPTSPRRSGSPTPAPTSTPSPSPSAPSASSRTAPTPTPGSPSAAASAAASAPPSPSSRCGSSCARC